MTVSRWTAVLDAEAAKEGILVNFNNSHLILIQGESLTCTFILTVDF